MSLAQRTRRAGSAVALTVAVVAVLAAPAFAAINFTVVASPNVGTLHNELHSVAAVSATEMFAVGEYYNGTWDRGLILKGNGTTWTASTAPVPFASTHNQLSSVAMANATLGWAVGTYSKAKNSYNLVEKFTGTHWVLSSAANPTGITASEFNGIAVGTTHSVMAVGDAHTPTTPPHPVSYLYNGTSWRNIAVPNPGKISTHTYTAQLDAVTVVPGSLGKKFWAVGTYSNGLNTMPFFDLWNGLSWKQYKLAQTVQAFLNAHTTTHYPTPLSSVIASVTAGTANNVWAVGYYIVNHTAPTPSSNHTFAAHWNGTSWSMVLTPDRVSDATPNELSGVAGRMVSGKFVIYAVGRYFATPFDQTQVLQWDTATVPPSWLKITSANDTTNHNSLEGIAMLPGTGAVTVGTWFSGTSDRTLVETCASC